MVKLTAALREENLQLMNELVQRKLELAQLSEQHTKVLQRADTWGAASAPPQRGKSAPLSTWARAFR